MTVSISPIDVNTKTFGNWVETTNLIIDALASNVVTIGVNTGDVFLDGKFQVNTTFTGELSGGVIGAPAQLNVSSQTFFTNTVIMGGSNTQLGNFSTVHISGVSNTTHTILGVDPVTGVLTLNTFPPVIQSGTPTLGSTVHWNGTVFTNFDAVIMSPTTNNVSFANNIITMNGISANGSFGANGHMLISNGSKVYWSNTSPAQISANGFSTPVASANSNFNNGLLFVDTSNLRVGIGTSLPQYKLDVVGTINANNILMNGNVVWHAGNDGAGSTLDADLLDGIEATGFLLRNATSNTTGIVTFSTGLVANNVSANTITALSQSLQITANTITLSANAIGITSNAYFGQVGATNSVGLIDLLKTTGSTLAGNTTISTDGQRIQFFENGGTKRGAFIDLSKTSAAIGSELWFGGSFTNIINNGSMTLPNGLTMKWGRASATTSGGSTRAITFTSPFATAVYNVQLTVIDTNDSNITLNAIPTLTGFVMKNDSGGTIDDFFWFAIGV